MGAISGTTQNQNSFHLLLEIIKSMAKQTYLQTCTGLLTKDETIQRRLYTHPWPFSKNKFNLKSDRVNLVAPTSPIECLLYLPNVRAIQYKLGPERLTRLGNQNVLRLPVCTEVVLFVSPLYSGFPATVSLFLSLPNHYISH